MQTAVSALEPRHIGVTIVLWVLAHSLLYAQLSVEYNLARSSRDPWVYLLLEGPPTPPSP